MNEQDIKELLDKYWMWAKGRTVLKPMGDGWFEITTPYLDRHNDCLQIYARKNGRGIMLTDGGYIIDDLTISGCPVDSKGRQALLESTLAGFGVKNEGGRLTTISDPDEFPVKKHNIIQAMLAVNDLFYTASPYVANLFIEDVTGWLDASDIQYTPRIKFAGKSGYDHTFDFVIPKSSNRPECIVEAISNTQKSSVENLIFRWTDTKEIRKSNLKIFAVINDSNNEIPKAVVKAFKSYELESIPWSQRERAVGQLVT